MKIQLFIHLFDGKIKKYEVNNNISINSLIKIIKKTNKIYGDIKIKNGSGLFKYNDSLIENKINNDDTLYLYSILNGGFIDLLIDLVTGMAELLSNIGGLVEEIIMLFINIFELIPSIFSPDKLLNDVIYGTITGINSMITAIFGKMTFLGGDTNETKNDGSGGVFGIDQPNKAVCVSPSFINLILLILCPPLALYIKRGGFFLIIICGLMTYYLYYFPGFLFAALHILC